MNQPEEILMSKAWRFRLIYCFCLEWKTIGTKNINRLINVSLMKDLFSLLLDLVAPPTNFLTTSKASVHTWPSGSGSHKNKKRKDARLKISSVADLDQWQVKSRSTVFVLKWVGSPPLGEQQYPSRISHPACRNHGDTAWSHGATNRGPPDKRLIILKCPPQSTRVC